MKASDLSVLVVEDDLYSVELAEEKLEEMGITKIDAAMNEQQAIEYSNKNNYDLIICDTMYGSDYPFGPKIIKRIRANGKNPVVAALSSDREYKEDWKDYKSINFFEKGDFWTVYFSGFLKENFEI